MKNENSQIHFLHTSNHSNVMSENPTNNNSSTAGHGNVADIFISLFVFVLSGLLEIGGGWLVWQTMRVANKPWYFALIGSVLLVAYGFAATLSRLQDFARVYALYGAVFILMSIGWGALLDGFRPDVGDYVGLALVIAGACVMFFWPR